MQDESFKEYVLDRLGGFPNVSTRRMFSGWGLYAGGVFFGIISDGEVFFKVDDETRYMYTERGSRSFTYYREGKKVSLSYYLVPEEIIENKEVLYEWVDLAIQAQERSKGAEKKA